MSGPPTSTTSGSGAGASSMQDVLDRERAAVRASGASDAASAVAGPPGGKRLSGPGTRVGTTPAALYRSRDPRAFEWPTVREEEWRFTPLRRLRPLLDVAADDDGTVAEQPGRVTVEVDAAPEVEVREITSDDPVVGSVLTPADRPTAVAMAGFRTGHAVRVPRGVVASTPTTLTLRGEGGPDAGAALGHVVVTLEESAEAVVILDHVGSAAYAGNVEVSVGPNASLTLVSLQDWDDDALHLGTSAARIERDGRLRSHVVTLGGAVVRLVPMTSFGGRGATAELRGLSFADSGQHLEARLFVDHTVPDCTSDVVYKSALAGAGAHTVWVGDVLIRAEATGTETYELNRNLLLDDGARADSVPNLEIETGQIRGAGHASATGRFDDEQLFYLQARGIPEDEARRLVVRGFFAELLGQIGVPELEERLSRAVDAELEGLGR